MNTTEAKKIGEKTEKSSMVDTDQAATKKIEIAENTNIVRDVRNNDCIHGATYKFEGRSGDRKFDVNMAALVNKGPPAVLKIMCEDAVVMDVITIDHENKSYSIPFMSVMDGGGGHTLPRYGREHMKEALDKQLKKLLDDGMEMSPKTIALAMREADQELFGGFSCSPKQAVDTYSDKNPEREATPFWGEAWRDWEKKVAEVKEKYALTDKTLLTIRSKISQEYPKTGKLPDKVEGEDGKSFDKKTLQEIFEIVGPKGKVAHEHLTTNAMNAFFMNENGELLNVSYTRGDSVPFSVETGGENPSLTLTALGKVKEKSSSLHRNYHYTIKPVKNGETICSISDGFTDGASLGQIEEAVKKNALTEPKELAEKIMRQNIHAVDGDDKSIVAAKVTIIK